jgi:glycosyltransferase involved in cell wall biosynthesis
MNGARVSIIMPFYNEAAHLPRVLESISAQTFDHSRLYVIAVDGDSSDGSAALVRRWLAEHDIAGIVLSNRRRKIPISLNIGLRHAGDLDFIVRLDAHTVYGADYIAEAMRMLESLPADTGCIGAAHVPIPGKTFSQRVVEALYTNPMGLGGADYRFGSDIREVDNAYLGIWKPGVLAAAGGFNEALDANEDGEMSARIRDLRYRIFRVPLPCKFIINRGPWGAIRQWHRYGFWRCRMLRDNPRFIRRRHVINPAAAALALMVAISPVRLLLLPMFLVYSLLVVRGRAKGESPAVTLAAIGFFPVLQFAYAAGMFAGLLSGGRGRFRPRYVHAAAFGDQPVQ